MQLGSLGERNLIWCILALTDEIWWQQFYFFPENEHSKLANVMHFKRMFMSCLEDWGGLGHLSAPLSTPLGGWMERRTAWHWQQYAPYVRPTNSVLSASGSAL